MWAVLLTLLVILGGLLLLPLPGVFSKNLSRGELTRQVRTSIEEQRSSHPLLKGSTIEDLELVHSGGNQYTGILTLRSPLAGSYRLTVDVTVDGDRMMWRAHP